jgi:predicted nucleic acid-binding protein
VKNRRFLIDTSAWLFALRKNPHKEIKRRIEKLLQENVVVLCGMIKLELLGSIKTENEFSRLKVYLDVLENIEMDSSLWDEASKLAFELRKKGVTLPYTDILIAAAAIRADAELIHTDSHFDLIARHSQLKVESFASKVM